MLHLIGTYFSLFHVLSFVCVIVSFIRWVCVCVRCIHVDCRFERIKRERKPKKKRKNTHKSCQLPSDKIYSWSLFGTEKSRWKLFHMQCNRFWELNWTWHHISYHQFSYYVYNFYYYRSTWILSFDAIFRVTWKERKKTHLKTWTSSWKNDTWRIFFILCSAVCVRML